MSHQEMEGKMKCVIYDCDGVMFDSIEANTKLYNDLCAIVGRPPLKEEEFEYVHSHTVFESMELLFGNDYDPKEKALDLLKQVDLRNYIGYLKMEPHLLETLERLKERGLVRVINTNRTTSMKYIMEHFNLWPYFEMVVTALDVKNPKPHPESIQKILQKFKLRREEAVFIGDSKVDQQTAISSGIKFIVYKNREITGDAFIEDHLDLLNLIS